ncbi:MAG: hypothetical protein Q9181_007337 [Wetmoreana brouardii]
MGERMKDIRRWLSAPDPSSNYNKGLKDRHANTGTWFLEKDVYVKWLSESGSLLWLYGIPGCGKTILSSTITQDTIGYCQSRSDSVVLYFYFDFNDTEKQGHEKMRQPRCDTLLETLHQMMRGQKETYIILDALDECLKRDELMTCIEELASWKDASLHILTTSRREKDIEECMEPLIGNQERICIQSRLVDDDIRAYVHNRLRSERGLKKWNRQPHVLNEIEEELMDKADGIIDEDNYEYAFKILQWLAYSARPLGLEELAEVIAIDVEGSPRFDPANRFPEPRDILMICSSLVTLDSSTHNDMDEGGESLDDGSESLDNGSESLDDGSESLVNGSENVVVRRNRVVIRLAHFSVKEYLVSKRILQGDARRFSVQETSANALICSDCLAYLLQFKGPYSNNQSLTEFRLALYAAHYWVLHAQVVERDADFEPPMLTELFLTEESGLLSWIRLYKPTFSLDFMFESRAGSNGTPLYYAAQAGLHKWVQILLNKGADVNTQGGYFGNALQAAAAKGHDQVVRILLDKGANINAQSQGGEYGNALQAAAGEGHDQVVQLLLDKGANINAQSQGGEYSNALEAAAIHGHVSVVQLLLDKGADVNAQGREYGNALQAAAWLGHDQVIQLLLDKGANISAQGGFFSNALQAAAWSGHDQVVQLLLDKGADVNAQGGIEGNALQAAAAKGHDQLVQLLLDKGANVNAQDKFCGNALQAAAGEGHDQVVQLLLDKGADVNAQGGIEGNALQAAAAGGHDQLVQLLLDKGAEVNAQSQGGEYSNALQAAARGGHHSVVQLLLDKGANVNAQGGFCGNALQAAADKGHDEVVQLLLDKGANVNAQSQGGEYGNALEAAKAKGHHGVVQLLLEHGATEGPQ